MAGKVKKNEYITIINDMMFKRKTDGAILSFQKIKPQKILEKFIEYYWISKSNNPVDLSAKIIEDGSIDILFLFDAEYNIKVNQRDFSNISHAHFIGSKKINTYFSQKGLVNVVGIRFRPGGFYPFLQIPVKEISDSYLRLDILFGYTIPEIEEKLYNAKSSREKIAIIEFYLMRRLSQNINNPNYLGLRISNLLQSKSRISIEQLCNDTGFYYKKIERIFLDEIGLTPKYLTRIIRFQNVLHSLLNSNFNNFSEVAYNNNYFDQAHFIKDFEYFIGTSPQNFTYLFDRNSSVI